MDKKFLSLSTMILWAAKIAAQNNLMNQIARANKNCAVVMVAGNAVSMDNRLVKVLSVLFARYPDEHGGKYLADVFRNENPAGSSSDDILPTGRIKL